MQMRIEDGWVVVTLGEFEIKVPAEDDSGADERIEITAAGRRLWVELVDGELIATEPEPVVDLSPCYECFAPHLTRSSRMPRLASRPRNSLANANGTKPNQRS
jgi:hypothetical protein